MKPNLESPPKPPRETDVDPAPPRETRAWFIWSLHLILGLILGIVPGLYLWTRVVRIAPEALQSAWMLPCGTALLGGCLASLFGNRLWYRPSIWMDEEPQLSRGERVVSLVIGAVGVGLVLCALIFGVPWISGSSPSSGGPLPKIMVIPPLASVALFLWLTIGSLRDGTALDGSGKVNREDSPAIFWTWVVFCIGGLITGTLMVLRVLWV